MQGADVSETQPLRKRAHKKSCHLTPTYLIFHVACTLKSGIWRVCSRDSSELVPLSLTWKTCHSSPIIVTFQELRCGKSLTPLPGNHKPLTACPALLTAHGVQAQREALAVLGPTLESKPTNIFSSKRRARGKAKVQH